MQAVDPAIELVEQCAGCGRWVHTTSRATVFHCFSCALTVANAHTPGRGSTWCASCPDIPPNGSQGHIIRKRISQ